MKNGKMIAIVALVGLGIYFASKGGIPGITPIAAKAVTAGEGTPPPSSKIVSVVPPPGTQFQDLGLISYAPFTTPIDIGSGFKQWGVTPIGTAVVSMNPPETYSAGQWAFG